MERLKAIDLQNAKFRKTLRGYDPAAVNAVISQAEQTIHQLDIENSQLRNDNERLQAEVNRYRQLENSLRDAIMIAQRAADETRANAHKEADLILESARQKAKEEQHLHAQEIKSLLTEIDSLKKEKERFERQFRTLLNEHLKELNQTATVANAVIEAEEKASVSE